MYSILEAQVVRMSLVQMLSFTATGMPAKGDRLSPLASSSSTALAWSIAESRVRVI